MPSDGPIVTLTHLTLNVHTEHGDPIEIPSPNSLPTCITANPISAHIAEGTAAGKVILRDAQTLNRNGEIEAATSAKVTCIAVSSSATLLATGHSDGTVALHDLSVSNAPTTFKETASVLSLSFHQAADPRYLAALTSTSVAVYSPTRRRLVTRIVLTAQSTRSYTRTPLTAAKLTTSAFSPLHTSLLVAADDTGCVTVWDVLRYALAPRPRSDLHTSGSPQPHARFMPALRAPAAALAFAGDGTLVVGGFDKQLRFFDPALTRLLFTVPCPAPVSALALRTQRAVLGLTDGSFVVAELDISRQSVSFTTRVHMRVSSSAPSVAVRTVLLPGPPVTSTGRRLDPSTTRPISLSTPASGNPGISFATLRSAAAAADKQSNLPSLSSSIMFETSTNLLESIDDLLSGRAAHDPNKAPSDTDVFSPVSKRSPARKMSGGFASDDEGTPSRSNIAQMGPRSRSEQDIAALSNDPLLLDLQPSQDDQFISPSTLVKSTEGSGTAFNAKEEPIIVPSSSKEDARSAHENPLTQTSNIENRVPNDETTNAVNVLPKPASNDFQKDRYHADLSIHSQRIARPLRGSQTSDSLPPKGRSELENSEALRSTWSNPLFSNVLSKVDSSRPRSQNHSQSSTIDDTQRQGYIQSSRAAEKESDSYLSNGMGNGGVTTAPQQNTSTFISTEESDSASKHGSEYGRQSPMLGKDSIEQLSGILREALKVELEEKLTDLRNDILNIHSEMVVMASQHSEELKAVIVERDEWLKRLKDENDKLRADNERLRRKYGLV